MQMVTMPSRFLAASLRATPVEAPSAGPADLGTWFSHGRLLLDKLDPLAFARYLIAFFIGVIAAVAWQSYVGPTGPAAASAANPPDQQQLNAILLDSARRHIDRLAANIAAIEEQITRGVGQLGAGQEQLTAGQEQLAASQEQMTHEIARLQAALSKNSEPSLRLSPAPAPKLVQRPSQAPAEAIARSDDWRRQPCCQWPASGSGR
jgi:hypothetical protein